MHLLPALMRSYRYCSQDCIKSLHNSFELLRDKDKEYVDIFINGNHGIDITSVVFSKLEIMSIMANVSVSVSVSAIVTV